MRLLVVGAAGQLGGAMAAAAAAAHDVIAWTRREADITDAAAIERRVRDARPDAVINCAAFARVDEAEDAPVEALAVNAVGPLTLARACAAHGAALVHFSTDFVFDGTAPGPHRESDPPNPSGVYAVSKLAGEWMAATAPRHYILRVESLFGGATRKSSIDVMLERILADEPVRAFSDRTVSPSFVDDVAAATLALLAGSAPCGVYHCVNTGETTWSELARELARLAGRPHAAIQDVHMAGLAMRVRRPLRAALSNAKLRGAGVTMPTWQDALARHVRRRLAEAPSTLR
jgi:dTDP-4-dehydrorhamnose reductase